jgi:hypothetical protein
MACLFTTPDGPRLLRMGCLKECIYRNHPDTTLELKHAIWDEIVTINQELLHKVLDNFVNHFTKVLQMMLSSESNK